MKARIMPFLPPKWPPTKTSRRVRAVSRKVVFRVFMSARLPEAGFHEYFLTKCECVIVTFGAVAVALSFRDLFEEIVELGERDGGGFGTVDDSFSLCAKGGNGEGHGDAV